MSNIDTYSLLVSKENIQPLRQGRDTAKLCTALQAETNSEIQQTLEKQRNEYEIKLRSNYSEDPLDDWCDYIHWIEQSYPKQPREGKLNVILRKCLNKFKDCEKYKNDIRFVKLCIKYADFEENTVELLGQIHHHGIGVACAELYIAWAEKYAMSNCFKKANLIYEKGIQNGAEPVELLKEAHQNFHAFIVRRMLNEKEEFKPTFLDSAPLDSRQPYNVLKPVNTGHNEVISSVRIGSHVKGSPGKLKMTTQDKKTQRNTAIKIFEDEDDQYVTVEPKATLGKIPNKKTLSKENTMKPGPWTDKHNKKVPFAIGSSSIPFEVHRDEGSDEPVSRSQNVPSSVLKSHSKKDIADNTLADVPLFYPDPCDSTKRVMYCKDQVYAGGQEFQFEELRAIHYNKKIQEREIETIMSPFENELHMQSPVKSVEGENSHEKITVPVQLESQSEKLSEDNIKPQLTDQKGNSFPIYEEQPENNENFRKPRRTMSCKQKPLQDTLHGKSSEEPLIPTDSTMNQTIHTKEALSEMQQLWFSKPASPLLHDETLCKQAGKSILKPAKPGFNLYIDESCLHNFKLTDEPDRPLDLTLKCNRGSESPLCNQILNVTGNNFDLVSNCETNLEKSDPVYYNKGQKSNSSDEDKENNVPSDYCGPVGKSTRKTTGILTPSEDIPVDALSDIEVNEDEEEENDIEFPGVGQYNITGVTETFNNLTKAFQFPRNESTPNPRKSCYNRQDVNRSLFDLQGNENNECQSNDVQPVKIYQDPEISSSKKQSPCSEEPAVHTRLSVIAETSREYKSSSSGSSGITTLQARSFKNYPVTQSSVGSTLRNASVSQNMHCKIKGLSLTGYEASTESSHTVLKTLPIPEETVKEPSIVNLLSDNHQVFHDVESSDLNAVASQSSNCTNPFSTGPLLDLVDIDPFNNSIIDKFLEFVRFPNPKYSKFCVNVDSDFSVPKIGSSIMLGDANYEVKKLIGEGSYAKVYDFMNKTSGHHIVGKVEKPSFPWEFYIIKELHLRITEKQKEEYIMDVECAYFFNNASVLLMKPAEYGNLLDTINVLKLNQQLSHLIAVHFTVEILTILEIIHKCKIIHADIKPDNFLVMNGGEKPKLQLTDFGRSIDMTLFPDGTTFKKVITTESCVTTEMRSGKPWTYQVDLFGAANCSHCLLFGDYMNVMQENGVWNITKIIPRYWARTKWKNYFSTLLNIESCDTIPEMSSLRNPFIDILMDNKELDFILSHLNKLLSNR